MILAFIVLFLQSSLVALSTDQNSMLLTNAASQENFHECLHYYNNQFPNSFENVASCGKEPDLSLSLDEESGIWYKHECTEGRTNYLEQKLIVSHEYRFIYIANWKVMSSSVRATLSRLFGTSSYPIEVRELPENLDFKNYYFFTFVRDPWVRFKSATWQYRQSKKAHLKDMAIIAKRLSEGYAVDMHYKTQFSNIFLEIKPGKPLHYDFIGKLENVADDWTHVLNEIRLRNPSKLASRIFSRGMDVSNTLPRQNQSFLRSEIESDDPDFQKLYCKIYAQDYKCFKYELPKFCN